MKAFYWPMYSTAKMIELNFLYWFVLSWKEIYDMIYMIILHVTRKSCLTGGFFEINFRNCCHRGYTKKIK